MNDVQPGRPQVGHARAHLREQHGPHASSDRGKQPAVGHHAHMVAAIGAGTDVAIESADIVLVRSDPRDVVAIVSLARATYRKMVQNLWWATGYNIVAIRLAAGVLAPVGVLLRPAVGAIFMSLSTVIVLVAGTDVAVPFDRAAEYLDRLPRDRSAKLVLHCRTGRMSTIAARELVARGYTDVRHLAGEMVAWARAGYPIVRADRRGSPAGRMRCVWSRRGRRARLDAGS